jgi:YidC/Oxa1 family membrane protein insertase
MDQKQVRLFLALGLCLLLLYLYQKFFTPPIPQKTSTTQTDQTDSQVGDKQTAEGEKKAKTGKEKSKQIPKSAGKKQAKPVTKDQSIVIDSSEVSNPREKTFLYTDRYYLELDTLGGRVTRFFLRNYQAKNRKHDFRRGNRVTELIINGKKEKALEITEGDGMNFQIFTKKSQIAKPMLDKANFRLQEISEKNESKKVSRDEVVFSIRLRIGKDKIELNKVYKIFQGENFFHFSYSLRNLSKNVVYFGNNKSRYFLSYLHRLGPLKGEKLEDDTYEVGNLTAMDIGNYYNFYFKGDSLEKITSVEGGSSFLCSAPKPEFTSSPVIDEEEPVLYIGSSSKYFVSLMAILNRHGNKGAITFSTPQDYSRVAFSVEGEKLSPIGEEDSRVKYNFAMFLGIREVEQFHINNKKLLKKDLKGISALESALKQSFDVSSFLAPFRDAILTILRLIYKVVPNYGWAIIVFAILFKLVFYPLNQKQAVSMKKMQAISPLLKEINKKYANNAQEKQKRLMEVYKKHKINPVSGCLPMLIQMPIFIALYGAFGSSVELWGANFISFWISDLSQPDTVAIIPIFGTVINLNLLPLIMTGSQIAQTKLTPVSGDANQQKIMMYLMPVMVLLFLWNMPSGLTLYWTVSNFLSILQQVYTNRKISTNE